MTDVITWIDSTGLGTLSNGKPNPATRFGNWRPDAEPIGPTVVTLGEGVTHIFEFREDNTVSFEINYIPQTAANVRLAKRLKLHLMRGGAVSINTDRPTSDDYLAYRLAPGTVPSMDDFDREMLEFTFSVTLKGVETVSDDDFLPSFVPGLKFWFEGEFLSSVYSDGDFVSTLPDHSGEENDAEQADFALQGTFDDGALNGLPVVGVTTPKGFYTTPTINNPTDHGMTLFFVMRATQYRFTGTLIQFVSDPSVPTNDADNRIQDYQEGGNEWIAWNQVGSGTNAKITDPPNEWNVGCISMTSGRVATPYENGIEGTDFNILANFDSDQKLTIFSGGNLGSVTGQCAAVLYYEGVLADEDRENVTEYLMAKYGIVADDTTPLTDLEDFDWVAWLAADQESFANNDPVPTATDQSGSGHHATQATSGNRPTFKTNIINSKPTFYFDGTNDVLNFASGAFSTLTAETGADIFVVLKLDDDTPVEAESGLWVMGSSGGANNTHYRYTDGKIYDDAGSTTRKTVDPVTDDLSVAHLYHVHSTDAIWTAGIDGTQLESATPNIPGFSTVVSIGKSIGSYYLKGHIAELLIGPALSLNDRTRVINFLKTKYAIS